MFGKQETTNRVTEYRSREITGLNGNTIVREYEMKDYNKDNTLYVIDFNNPSTLEEVAGKRVKLIGRPDLGEFKSDLLLYVGIQKYTLMHIHFFDNVLKTKLAFQDEHIIINDFNKSPYNMRKFLQRYIKGVLVSFGYDKDLLVWKPLLQIKDQASVGEVATYRILKPIHVDKITQQLNKKFPTGKKG